MAAPSVSTDLAFFTGTTGNSSCDALNAGDWTATNVTAVLDTDYQIENTGCLSAKLTKTGATLMSDVFIISAASLDMTGKNVYIWLLCLTPALLDTKAAGGLRIRFEDSSGNYGEWYVDGSDTYPGGWQCYCVNTATAFNVTSATSPTISAMKKIGWTVRQGVTGANKTNFFWDAFRYGTGHTLTLGDTSTPGTIENFFTFDNTSKYGVVRKFKGVYLVQGKLTIGSTGSANTYFSDTTGAVVIFNANPKYVAPTGQNGGVLYDNAATPAVLAAKNELAIVGGSGTTEVYFGQKVGSSAVNGTVFKSEDKTYRYKVTATETDITKWGFYGCVFQDGGVITGQAYNANMEFLSCTFARCERVEPSTGLVTSCVFSGAPGVGLLLTSASHYMTSGSFLNCGVGIEFSTATTYAISSCVFSGNTIDVANTSGGSVTVNATSCTGLSTEITTLASNNKAQTYNNTGTAYADVSTPTFDATAYDTNILSDANPEVNDAFLFGNTAAQFTSILLRQEIMSSAVWTIAWEYSTGAGTWSALSGVSDGTTGFTVTSPVTKRITFTAPGGGWVTATYNSITAYWIRARVSAYTSRATSPKGTQAWLGTTDATTVNTTVTLKATVKNAAGNAIEGVKIRFEKVSDGSLVSNGTTLGTGIYTDSTYSYPGSDVPVRVVARLKGYQFNSLLDSIVSTGLSVAFTLIKDRAVNLP